MTVKIDETLLDRENAQRVEEMLCESLSNHKGLEGIARELALNVTIPVAKYCEMAGSDSDTRFEVHLMLMRSIALGWAHHIENHVKPEGVKPIVEILEKFLHDALQDATKMVEEARMTDFLSSLGIEVVVLDDVEKEIVEEEK